MTNEAFHAKLAEVEAKINFLPAEQRARLADIVAETKRRHYDLKKCFATMRDAVDDWRLRMKYLVYDLERTRAELQQYRQDPDGG